MKIFLSNEHAIKNTPAKPRADSHHIYEGLAQIHSYHWAR